VTDTAPRRLVVVGQGYVGLPLAVRAVEVGYEVVGLDVDADRVARLMAGSSYIEDITDERLASVRATGRYTASTDAASAAGFDVAVITVPTPLREGSPDLSFIEDSARALAHHLRPAATVVLESTTWPGTTEEFVGPILQEISGLTPGSDFHLGYSPERIDPGNQRWQLHNTPKVVSGVDPESLVAVQGFYDDIVETTVPVKGTREAELTKLLENTFRHVNVALVNELAIFASELGADIWEAIDAATSKPFGYMRFTPGPGVGGHCLPIDPSYLSWRVKRKTGHNFRFVELANDVNEHMPDHVVHRLTLLLNARHKSVNGSQILAMGLAYKPNTGDARESPARVVIERLVALGGRVRVADPHVDDRYLPAGSERVDLTPDEVRDAEAVVLLTDHSMFDYEMVQAHARLVLDTRRRLVGANVHSL
jgi:UDP-N-acetyl-D-glucosamine dehydrogenase